MPRMHRWAVVILAAGAAAAACDGGKGGPTGPEGPQVRLTVVAGDAQLGLPGETLPLPLRVQATRADGTVLAGATLRFAAEPGAGSVVDATVVTNDEGIAFTWWTLPADLPGTPSVRVEASGAAPAVFTAGRLPNARADLLLSREPRPMSVMVYNSLAERWSEAFRARFTDSLLVRPFAAPAQFNEVFAFSAGSAPMAARVTWSTGRDTLRVGVPPAPVVPMTIWVVRAPFAPLAEVSRAQADSAAAVWSRGGIRFDVRIVDATEYPNAAEYQGNEVDACRAGLPERIGRQEGRLNVYYVGGIYDPRFNVGGQAVYCGDEMIVMAASNTRSPWLLGHEIGHAFGLNHDAEGNLMDTFGRGRHVTAGQIFRAHFHRGSVINTMMGFYPLEQVRECNFPGTQGRRCPPTWLDME